ncbi:MAG: hypothetical protein GY928_00400, partial [Colwellia sp.]|nr:hypothetical protein [Colwellia sp.]
ENLQKEAQLRLAEQTLNQRQADFERTKADQMAAIALKLQQEMTALSAKHIEILKEFGQKHWENPELEKLSAMAVNPPRFDPPVSAPTEELRMCESEQQSLLKDALLRLKRHNSAKSWLN